MNSLKHLYDLCVGEREPSANPHKHLNQTYSTVWVQVVLDLEQPALLQHDATMTTWSGFQPSQQKYWWIGAAVAGGASLAAIYYWARATHAYETIVPFQVQAMLHAPGQGCAVQRATH